MMLHYLHIRHQLNAHAHTLSQGTSMKHENDFPNQKLVQKNPQSRVDIQIHGVILQFQPISLHVVSS